MADKINKPCYAAMIDGLNRFAKNVSSAVEGMQELANGCVQILDSEDKAIAPICSNVQECQTKYLKATAQAREIASLMQQELENAQEEDGVWSSDE